MKPNKIIACGDIHMFQNKRFKEHRHVFENFYFELEREKPDLIVIPGDLIDSKAKLSPEQVELCRDFLHRVSDYAPLIIIPGNHDSNLNNKDRLDSLSPIIYSLYNETKNPIHYFTNSGIYSVMSINWAVWSCIDKQKNPFLENKKTGFTIGLYHGVLTGCTTDDNFKLNGGIDISEFVDCDMVIMSDIHKQQSFRNGEINYTGSLLQISVNENPEGSYLIYTDNGNNYDVEVKRIKNKYSTIILTADSILPEILPTQKVRFKFDTDKYSRIQALENVKKLKLSIDENIKVDIVPIVKKRVINDIIVIDQKSEINSDNLGDYFIEYTKKGCDKLGITDLDNDLPLLLEYDKNFSLGEIKDYEQGDFFIHKLILNNFLSFAPKENIINIDKNGLLGIVGKNRVGKSSIIKSIQFGLFNEMPSNSSALKMINKLNRSKPGYVELFFIKNGKNYRIKRTLTPDKKMTKVNVDLIFEEIDDKGILIENLTKESRPYTESEIRKYLGFNEIFEMLSLFSAQKRQTEFIDCKNAERLQLVNKFLGLQNFELKEENVKNILKEKNAIYNTLITQFDKEINIELLNTELKKFDTLLKINKDYQSELKKSLDELEDAYKDVESVYISSKRIASKTIPEPTLLLKEISELDVEIEDTENKINSNNEEADLLEKNNKILIEKFEKEVEINPLEFSSAKAKPVRIILAEERIVLIKFQERELNAQLKIDLCNSCGKTFSDADKKKVISKLDDLSKERESLFTLVSDNAKEIEELEKRVKDINSVSMQINNLRGIINLRLNNCIKDINLKKIRIGNQVSEFRHVEEAKKIVVLLEEKVNTFNYDKKIIIEEINLLIAEESKWLTKTKEVSNKILSYNEKIKVITNLEEELRVLKIYRKIVNKDGLPLFILQNKIDEINEKVNNVISQVFEFSVEFSIDEDKGALKIQFSYDGDPDKNDVGLASGSEMFIINLCIKVALAQISLLPKIDTVFIDEGYDSLDKDTLEKLPGLFEMLTNYYKNVITISHLDDLKDMCSSQIKLVKVGKYTEIID